jgi:hypothetical protein
VRGRRPGTWTGTIQQLQQQQEEQEHHERGRQEQQQEGLAREGLAGAAGAAGSHLKPSQTSLAKLDKVQADSHWLHSFQQVSLHLLPRFNMAELLMVLEGAVEMQQWVVREEWELENQWLLAVGEAVSAHLPSCDVRSLVSAAVMASRMMDIDVVVRATAAADAGLLTLMLLLLPVMLPALALLLLQLLLLVVVLLLLLLLLLPDLLAHLLGC